MYAFFLFVFSNFALAIVWFVPGYLLSSFVVADDADDDGTDRETFNKNAKQALANCNR